jgi:hypothetical protein
VGTLHQKDCPKKSWNMFFFCGAMVDQSSPWLFQS